MGFPETRLAELNPRLVVASVNGYGSTGPYVDRPAIDFIAQAMSGSMSVNGPPDGEPLRAGPPISDLVAGLYAAFGERGTTGGSQRVEASLTGSLISMLAYFSAHYFATGELPERTGNDHPVVYPYGLFHAADGDVAIAPSTPAIVERLLAELSLADLLYDPDFASNAARAQPRAPQGAHQCQDRGAQCRRLDRAPESGGRALRPRHEPRRPPGAGQDMVLEAEHPGRGPVRMTGFPVKLSATLVRLRRPAPEPGAHTDQILAEAGYAPAQIAALRHAGVI